MQTEGGIIKACLPALACLPQAAPSFVCDLSLPASGTTDQCDPSACLTACCPLPQPLLV